MPSLASLLAVTGALARPANGPVMTGRRHALVRGVTTGGSGHELEVAVFDGPRRGTVGWDPVRCSYRAEIEILAPVSGADRNTDRRLPTADSLWGWLVDPAPSEFPYRLAVGHRPAELLTIDSVINRLLTLGFRPDRESVGALFELRSTVQDRCGSVVFQGRLRRGAPGSPSPGPCAEMHIGLPHGEPLRLRPLVDHPDHGFGWGRRGAPALRTASALVDLAWSPRRDAATDAAVVDLAVTVLAEVCGGFLWRVESVADWIATQTGELSDETDRIGGEFESGGPSGFRQLTLEFR